MTHTDPAAERSDAPDAASPATGGRRDRRGVALLTALLGVVVVTAMIVGGFFASTQEFRAARNQLVEQRAFAVAEYGLNYEISDWDRSRNLSSSSPPPAMKIGSSIVKRRYVAGDDTAFVTITRLTETTFWVVSDGKAQMGNSALESRRRTSAYVRLAYPVMDVKAAVTAAGNIDVNGSSTITGQNTNPSAWSCAPVTDELHAVRVPPGATVDNKSGSFPGTKDVLEDPAAADSNTYVRYGTETWTTLVSNADIQLAGGILGTDILPVDTAGVCVTSTTNWGEPRRLGTTVGSETLVPSCFNHFPIIYSAGDLTLNGKGRGQGILLVNGDLRINGSLDFFGIVIVRDDIEKGNGNATIHGAVFSRDATVGDESYWAGTQNVYYSSCAVENALRGSAILTRVAERHWTQLH